MIKHDFFDLFLHTDDELSTLLGEPIVERTQLHAWPFSVVERLTMADGTRWIYKAQRTPTVEPDFYGRVRSPLLAGYRVLTRDGAYSTMLFEFVDAPLLRDLSLSDAELAAHGVAVVEAIGQLASQAPSDTPLYIDIGDRARWRAFVDSTLGMLSDLLTDGRFALALPPGADVDVAAWSESDGVRSLIERTSRLTHGDLNAGNVFVRPDSYCVIDWQRPRSLRRKSIWRH